MSAEKVLTTRFTRRRFLQSSALPWLIWLANGCAQPTEADFFEGWELFSVETAGGILQSSLEPTILNSSQGSQFTTLRRYAYPYSNQTIERAGGGSLAGNEDLARLIASLEPKPYGFSLKTKFSLIDPESDILRAIYGPVADFEALISVRYPESSPRDWKIVPDSFSVFIRPAKQLLIDDPEQRRMIAVAVAVTPLQGMWLERKIKGFPTTDIFYSEKIDPETDVSPATSVSDRGQVVITREGKSLLAPNPK